MKSVVIIACIFLIHGVGMAAAKKGAGAIADLRGLSEEWVRVAEKDEPPLLMVEEAAMRHAQLLDNPGDNWRKKARQSAALPTLSVGVETGYLNRANFNVQDSISVNSSGVTIGPEANNTNQYATNQTMVTAKAVWSLPDTIFHRQTLPIEHEIRNRFNERAKLSDRVSSLYFERLRLKTVLLATRAHPGKSLVDRISVMTALKKVSGDLNMMTGGWFEQQVKGDLS